MKQLIVNYFEEIATKNKLLAHTEENPRFAADFESFSKLANGKMNLKNMVLYLEGVKSKLQYPGADQFNKYKSVTFFLLKAVSKTSEQQAVYEEAETILDQVKARMNLERNLQDGSVMDFFRPDSLQWEEVGPEIKNSYGLMVRFDLLSPDAVGMFYNQDHWLP